MCGHLYLVGFPLLDDDNMKMIFSTILDWKLQADNYPGEVSGLSKKKVAGTLEIYGDLQSGGGSASTDTPEGSLYLQPARLCEDYLRCAAHEETGV
mmetsp:Transcript_82994/g.169155  ORF Transcript_82994/g.169155 Transcript_82994/m.169155 type:complete len:96 (-) Transcript_82994:93-380(-)